MIGNRFNLTVAVSRMTWTTTGGIDSSSLTALDPTTGHLEQASTEDVANLPGNMTVTHNLYCPCTADIETGDTVTIDTKKYGVRAVHNYCFIGQNKHQKALLEELTT